MTTNKPEVAAYLHTSKENPEHRGVSLHHDASCTNTLINTEPLIRLSDYEALQAEFVIRLDELSARNYELRMGLAEKTSECEKMRKGADQYRRLIELGEDFQWENIIRVDISDFPSRAAAIDEAIDAARAGGRK